MPSVGRLAARAALYRLHMQQRTWLCRSRSVKYQCPLDHALHPTTSPRTQTGMNPPSTSRLVGGAELADGPDSSVGAMQREREGHG